MQTLSVEKGEREQKSRVVKADLIQNTKKHFHNFSYTFSTMDNKTREKSMSFLWVGKIYMWNGKLRAE